MSVYEHVATPRPARTHVSVPSVMATYARVGGTAAHARKEKKPLPGLAGFLQGCREPVFVSCICWSSLLKESKWPKSRITPGGTSRKTETLKAAGSAAWGRKANIGPRRTCSGSCRMLKAGPGQEVCVVCVCVSLSMLGLLLVRAGVNVSVDFCSCHCKVAVLVCVCARACTLFSKCLPRLPSCGVETGNK